MCRCRANSALPVFFSHFCVFFAYFRMYCLCRYCAGSVTCQIPCRFRAVPNSVPALLILCMCRAKFRPYLFILCAVPNSGHIVYVPCQIPAILCMCRAKFRPYLDILCTCYVSNSVPCTCRANSGHSCFSLLRVEVFLCPSCHPKTWGRCRGSYIAQHYISCRPD